MKIKICDWIANFIFKYGLIIFLSIAFVVFLASCNIYFPTCGCSIINGLFIFFTAITTSIFAIHKYKSEQRAARLQKIYFEDALLGQARSIEEMMSQTSKNIFAIEDLCNLISNILKNSSTNMEDKKNLLNHMFNIALNRIQADISTTDFKKETISKLLYDSVKKWNALPSWIKEFEEDAYRFASFAKAQVLMLKPDIEKITETNLDKFKEHIGKILDIYVQENYLLIKRHYILFHLFSELVLEFSAGDYTTKQDILLAFKKEKIVKINLLINESYKDIVTDFDSIHIGKISSIEAIQLKERIKCTNEKISKSLA